MIDFHTHILHDIDDGPSSLTEALEMARIAILDGITTIVATPHSPGSHHGRRYSVELVNARLHELRAALQARSWPLEILPGTEMRYHTTLPIQLEKGMVLPCGFKSAVLLELPHTALPSDLEQVIFDLQIAGYRVVLAHPERIKIVQRDPNLLIPLIERNVLMQLTSRALTGEQGKPMQQLAELLVKHRLIHLIASDGHDATPRRSIRLERARQHAADLLGEEEATALVQDTPAALLSGAPLTLPEPCPTRRRRWLF